MLGYIRQNLVEVEAAMHDGRILYGSEEAPADATLKEHGEGTSHTNLC